MIKKSYAKINLAINVIDRNEDGYHNLDMIMVKIALHDKMYFSLMNNDEIKLTCTNTYIPCDERNLVYQMAKIIKDKYHITKGIRIHILKMIPMQAGLGGGSSNAACCLETLNTIFKLNMSYQDKVNISKKLGSDIAFFYHKGICRVKGVGNDISLVSTNYPKLYVILVKPASGNSTKQVYKRLNLNNLIHPNIDELIKAIKNKDYLNIINNMANSLEDSAIEIRPIIKSLMEELKELGVDKSIVCGSGSTILSITNNINVVSKVKQAHLNKKNFVYITELV